MKKIVSLLALLLSPCLLFAQGQISERFELVLDYAHKSQEHRPSMFNPSTGKAYEEGIAHTAHIQHLIPSVAYKLSSRWAVGLSAYIPLSSKEGVPLDKPHAFFYKDRGYETWAGELWLRYSVLRVWRLSLDLKLVGFYGKMAIPNGELWKRGITIDKPLVGGLLNEGETMEELEVKIKEQGLNDMYRERWQVGLRPQLSFRVWNGFSLHASYGFVGFFSHKDVRASSRAFDKFGYKGFNSNASFANNLRVGISYSF